jgi:heptosyltransferase-2
MAADDRTARVVVRPPNWLGDAVLALPAMAALRAHFADSHLTVAAAPAVAALFREETDVRPDRILELSASGQEAIATIEGDGFDVGVLFPNSFRAAWRLWRAGVSERWGFATAGRGWLLTRRSARPRGPIHQCDYFRALVRGLEIPCDDRPPRLSASARSAARAWTMLAERGIDPHAPLVGFAPGAAYGQAKQWLPERVAAVAAELARKHGAFSVVLGAPHDRAAARAIESWLRKNAPDAASHVVDLVGRTSIGALAGVTARCAVFVSNDSGAMHLAAALGRPVVAIFGPTDERATRPLGDDHEVITASVFCRPCMLRDCPIDHRCMKRITVDAVLAATAARLRRAAAAAATPGMPSA